MSWIWEKSATWRTIVRTTRASTPAMVAFVGACTAGSVVLGASVQALSNPADDSKRREKLCRSAGLDAQVMGKVNKERLGVLLDAVKNKSLDEDRYRLALDGRTRGTSSGTSQVVVD